MRAGVAFGANLGDRLGTMQLARERIMQLAEASGPWLSSAIYETEPVGCEPDANAFLNATMEFGFAGSPSELLCELRAIEATLGRDAGHRPNSSRTIDLDFLYGDREQITTAELQLPHPRLATRRFVLQPLADLRADLILPGQSESVQSLLGRLPASPAVVRFRQQW